MNYKVKSNLNHDGKSYEKGETIVLPEDNAISLLKDGIIANIGDSVEEEEPKTPQPAVNEVSRENDEVTGEQTVEPGEPDKTEEEEPEEEKKKGFFGRNKDKEEEPEL